MSKYSRPPARDDGILHSGVQDGYSLHALLFKRLIGCEVPLLGLPPYVVEDVSVNLYA